MTSAGEDDGEDVVAIIVASIITCVVGLALGVGCAVGAVRHIYIIKILRENEQMKQNIYKTKSLERDGVTNVPTPRVFLIPLSMCVRRKYSRRRSGSGRCLPSGPRAS